MVTSLVLKNKYTIGVDSADKIMVGDTKVKIKEVPFIRYRFDSFSEEDTAYIKSTMAKFIYSGHLAEVVIKDGFEKEVEYLNDTFENMAVFLYLPITDEHVTSCELTTHDIELLEKIDNSMIYDRIMLKDASETLYLVSANKLKQQVAKVTGVSASEMGICGSPLSFGEDACLTAVRARALASIYVENENCAIPSANHECMSCCGCIRYYVVESNIAAPVGSKGARGRKTKVDGANKVVGNSTEVVDSKPKKKISKKAMSAW